MTNIEKNLAEYIELIAEHDKKTRITSKTGLSEAEFKQNLHKYANSEREMGEKTSAIFAGLLPILKELRESDQYVCENIAQLTNFANSISGSPYYINPENPMSTDRYAAILIYRALLDNAMKDATKMDEQVIYTRDLAICLSHTVGWVLGYKAISYVEKLFEKIPISDCAKLSDPVKKLYIFCKFVWLVNHLNNIDLDLEGLDSLIGDMDDFKKEIDKYLPEQNLEWLDVQIINSQMVLGTFCEFGGSVPISKKFAQKHLNFMQQHNNFSLYECDTYDTAHLAWAQLAYKCDIISDEEYWHFLIRLAEKTMTRDTSSHNINLLIGCLQTGLSAIAVLCKYFHDLPDDLKQLCLCYAKKALKWIANFPSRGDGRIAMGYLGKELNTVLTVALSGLSRKEKALAILRLTTESTYAHSIFCAEMARDLAQSLIISHPHIFAKIFPNLNDPAEILNEIYVGALLHDIGKLEVSGPISQVLRSIFDEEFAQIKTHPARSLRYLSAAEFDCARACAIWHHEHFDGKGGYPL
ncbi:MAG: HD domain-containing protein, partial [Defluviitaleaceae bacterium]|nr:HD domain-containing protein [Defluviitaleaceae bacterium]